MLRQEKRVRQFCWPFFCLVPKSKLPIQVYYLLYKVWLWNQNQGCGRVILISVLKLAILTNPYVMLSSSDSFRDENSTYCGLTWYRARVKPRGKEFGNWKYFHAKIDQNLSPNPGPKKSMCPHLPPSFDEFSNKYKSKALQIYQNWIPNFWLRPDMANSNFGHSNYCY